MNLNRLVVVAFGLLFAYFAVCGVIDKASDAYHKHMLNHERMLNRALSKHQPFILEEVPRSERDW